MMHQPLRIFLLCLVAATAVPAAHAQFIAFGLKGGLSIPNLTGGDDLPISENYESRTAFTGGGFFELGLNDRWSLVGELNYSGQGGQRDYVVFSQEEFVSSNEDPATQAFLNFAFDAAGADYARVEGETIARLNYINVPLMVRYSFPISRLRIYFNGGVYLGYLASSEYETTVEQSDVLLITENGNVPIPLSQQAPPTRVSGTGRTFPGINPVAEVSGNLQVPDSKTTTDADEDLKDTDFGLTGGVGAALKVGPGEILFDARIQYGLVKIQEDPVNGENGTGAVFFSVGYGIKLGK